MNKARKFFCDLCGEIPAMKKEPSACPICGAEIQILVDESQKNSEKKRYATSDERAAEWFRKMREVVNQP